jgi:hypothetical protein
MSGTIRNPNYAMLVVRGERRHYRLARLAAPELIQRANLWGRLGRVIHMGDFRRNEGTARGRRLVFIRFFCLVLSSLFVCIDDAR